MNWGNALSQAWRELAYHRRGAFRGLAPVLLPLAWLFGHVSRLRRALYETGYLQQRRFPVPVISVGNLTVGGVGKTPFTLYLAELLQFNGYRPAIVMRGYGRRSPKPLILRSGPLHPHQIPTYGDEPALLSRYTEIPIGIGADRGALIQTLTANRECGIILLDDGFQHLPVHRDLDLVLLDGGNPTGNGHCLPYGPMREPASALRRADAVVFHDAPSPSAKRLALTAFSPVFTGALEWIDLIPLGTWMKQRGTPGVTISHFAETPVILVSGIGSPERLEKQARALGLRVHEHLRFPDHYWFSDNDIRIFALKSRQHPVLFTEKDAIRLVPHESLLSELAERSYVIHAKWMLHEPERFEMWLLGRMDALQKERGNFQGTLESHRGKEQTFPLPGEEVG
ncbi:MAG TPA: tetraacyldisaccharide 4'-kinase [bacterium]|nr:tetraacyldisaccharide 4'-kinase [bacterium]HXK93372.1 tetraacyldisaccharide 4'-kinase [bacterium]